MKKMVTQEFLSSGSWTAPAGVTEVIVYGLGGGAGGYGGGAGDTTTGGRSGPAGLSCAWLVNLISVTPNTTYTITIGAGGTGATGSSSGRDAVIPSGDGGDTSFGSLAIFKGAKATNSAGQFGTTLGVSDRYVSIAPVSSPNNGASMPNQTGEGQASGSGTTYATAAYWGWYFEEAAQGTAGTVLADGGRGLAGNSSRFGLGGTGGDAGIDGATETGGNGGNAGANTGAGGGSGGGSAASPGANNKGGDGGNGGSGRLLVMWFE